VEENSRNRMAFGLGNRKDSTERTGVSHDREKIKDYDSGKSVFKFSSK
jgi:hypothetical protein